MWGCATDTQSTSDDGVCEVHIRDGITCHGACELAGGSCIAAFDASAALGGGNCTRHEPRTCDHPHSVCRCAPWPHRVATTAPGKVALVGGSRNCSSQAELGTLSRDGTEYRCAGGKCIAASQFCDGSYQCYSMDDESPGCSPFADIDREALAIAGVRQVFGSGHECAGLSYHLAATSVSLAFYADIARASSECGPFLRCRPAFESNSTYDCWCFAGETCRKQTATDPDTVIFRLETEDLDHSHCTPPPSPETCTGQPATPPFSTPAALPPCPRTRSGASLSARKRSCLRHRLPPDLSNHYLLQVWRR